MSKTTLLVLAAGIGSRFGGVKQVEPVGPSGETTLEYSIYDALRAGFVFLIRSSIEADFRDAVLSRLPISVERRLAFQETLSLLSPAEAVAVSTSGRTKPWGTGHALLCAAPEITKPFAVVNADDFYGPESFRIVHDFLAASAPSSKNWCMAGFLLRNTTSEHGAVARGLCTVDDASSLVSVKEHTGITQEGGAFLSALSDGGSIRLSGTETVSMNLWGLSPEVFGLAEPLFRDFLAGGASSPTAEFYLPGVIDTLLSRGEARVRVLPTPEAWFGLTYRGDRAAAAARVGNLHASGAYPTPLWSTS